MRVQPRYVTPDQLCVGLYIHLDLGWMDHPFTFNSFKIRSQEQIERLRQLEIDRFRYDPARSDCSALELGVTEPAPPPDPVEAAAANDALLREKRARVERLERLRSEIDLVEKKFRRAAESLRSITRALHGQPRQAAQIADELVAALIADVLSMGDIKVHAIGEQLGEDAYFHALNVAVLSMVLGRALHADEDLLHQIGIGALFHDIGKTELPSAVVMKAPPLTRAEQQLLQTHCRLGVKLGGKLGLSDAALQIIGQHHEQVDGSGYPDQLVAAQLEQPARIVQIVNAYDNLCNPNNPLQAVTPAEALSQLFALHRTRFDEALLRAFIKCLGVYPPGSLVHLSNDMTGLVLSVNATNSLRPSVLVHDPDIPRDQAVIVDLAEEPELKIVRSLRPAALSPAARDYLNPRRHITYYVDRPSPRSVSR